MASSLPVTVHAVRSALALKAATHAYLYAGAVKHEAHQLLLPDAAEDNIPNRGSEPKIFASEYLESTIMQVNGHLSMPVPV